MHKGNKGKRKSNKLKKNCYLLPIVGFFVDAVVPGSMGPPAATTHQTVQQLEHDTTQCHQKSLVQVGYLVLGSADAWHCSQLNK